VALDSVPTVCVGIKRGANLKMRARKLALQRWHAEGELSLGRPKSSRALRVLTAIHLRVYAFTCVRGFFRGSVGRVLTS
jgi:hypothetical protein